MSALQGLDGAEVHLYQEIGINGSNIDNSNNWKSRTKRVKGLLKTQLAHNTNDSSLDPVQYGGTLVAINRKPVSWVLDKGKDSSGKEGGHGSA